MADEERGDETAPEAPEEQPKPAKRPLPESDPSAHQTKSFFTALRQRAALVVTLSGGNVAQEYAPALLISKFSDTIGSLVRDVGGGFQPMLYGVLPGNSMELYFGDPRLSEAQEQMPVEAVHEHALRIAQLIESESDELFARAVRLGSPAKRYSELARLVESEGVVLKWSPREADPVVLTPNRAEAHVFVLSREPELVERRMRVVGLLYRVIAEGPGRGTVGIRLAPWSARPSDSTRSVLIVAYDRPEVSAQIKNGLIGELVEATLIVREPTVGTSFDLAPRRPVLDAVRLTGTEETFGIDLLSGWEIEEQ